ncbi:SpoIIE family protein phosphatase [Streptomyces sp. NPDC057253]|uniref:SpoIIE family protein phosphatase n=1 Tax=Streptomyces sp. NPDC057253 TaxID=3346069 RepID=UPI0036355BCC
MGAIPAQRESVARGADTCAPGAGDVPAPGHVRAIFPGSPFTPGAARALLRSALEEWAQLGLPGTEFLTDRQSDDAVVVVSELVTNAVVHAGTEVELDCRLEAHTGALVVEVLDHHPSRAPRDGDTEASYGIPEYGRGLRLVAALAESWGITYRTGAKTVWARLPGGGKEALDGIQAYAGERVHERGLRVAGILAPEATGVGAGAGSAGVAGASAASGALMSGGVSMPSAVSPSSGGSTSDGAAASDGASAANGVSAPTSPSPSAPTSVSSASASTTTSDSDSDLPGTSTPPPSPSRVEQDRDWLNRGALSFLAEASDLLAGQLDENLVAALAGQLIVPRLADWCAVWLEDEVAGRWGSPRPGEAEAGGGWGDSGAPGPRLARVWHSSESRIEDLKRVLEKEPPRLPGGPDRLGPTPFPWPTEALGAHGSGPGSPHGSGPGSVHGSGPGSPHGSGPGSPHGSGPGSPHGSGPGSPHGSGPSSPQGSGSGSPQGSGPSSLHGSGPSSPHGSGPGSPHGSGPASPHGSGPSSAQGSGPGSPQGSGLSSPQGSALAYRLTAGGRPLGTLVIGRAGVSAFPDEITGLVEDLSRRVALAIGAARQYARQATISAVLQRGLLPGAVAEIPGVRSALVYEPCDKGGPSGDFYDLFPAGDGRWCFAVGDVQGKGPEAAVVIGLARPWLRLLAREGYRVADVLDRLNQLLLDDATEAADAAARALASAGGRPPHPGEGPQTRFLSLLYGELVPFDGGVRCTLASAGHPLPLLLGAGGEVRTAARPQTLLGVVEDETYTSETFELRPGDSLLCVTDGVTERRSGSRQFDDEDGLADALAGCAGLDAELIAERIKRLVHEFGARPPEDDLALLVLQAE